MDNGSASEAIHSPAGLWVEATPTLYEDGWAHYEMSFYEDRRGGRVRLDGVVGGGRLTRYPDGSSSPKGYTSDLLRGRSKMYVIRAVTSLTVAE